MTDGSTPLTIGNKVIPRIEEIFQYAITEKQKEYIKTHLDRFRYTLDLIPKNGKLKILDIGSVFPSSNTINESMEIKNIAPFTEFLKTTTDHKYVLHGYWNGKKNINVVKDGEIYNFNLETDKFPFNDHSFDAVFMFEVIEHLGLDPMHCILEARRVLKPNGMLYLSTPNAVSAYNVWKVFCGHSPYTYGCFTLSSDRHNREYTPHELLHLLKCAGFSANTIYTKNTYGLISKLPRLTQRIGARFIQLLLLKGFRKETIFVSAQKSNGRIERYPKEFYDI